jgi:adenylate cyclase
MLAFFSGYAEILRLLNDYAEILVEAIEARGGQVLKFMGDGILAIFRAAMEEDACEAALSAWIEATRRCAELARRRPAETHPYLALHAGEVLYGNIGGRARLDFTVLGHAVNEASRIAALCRSLDQPALMSEAFAAACPAHRRASLIGLGRHTLRGVSRPQTLFGLDPRAVEEQAPQA